MEVSQGILIGKQFVYICDQIEPTVVSVELSGKLNSK